MINLIREVLNNQVNDAFRGNNGNYAGVMEALDGVTAAQAAWKPGLNRNSIWQIVDHLSETKEWTIRAMVTGHPGPSPTWRECAGDEQAWAAEKQRLIERHDRLLETIANTSEGELVALVPELGRSTFDAALGVACAHEAYHAGQIQYLKLLGREAGVR